MCALLEKREAEPEALDSGNLPWKLAHRLKNRNRQDSQKHHQKPQNMRCIGLLGVQAMHFSSLPLHAPRHDVIVGPILQLLVGAVGVQQLASQPAINPSPNYMVISFLQSKKTVKTLLWKHCALPKTASFSVGRFWKQLFEKLASGSPKSSLKNHHQ